MLEYVYVCVRVRVLMCVCVAIGRRVLDPSLTKGLCFAIFTRASSQHLLRLFNQQCSDIIFLPEGHRI